MPELPEVEHTRGLLERLALGRRIIDARGADDAIVFDAQDGAALASSLVGRVVVATHRHGKYAWLELDRGPHLVFHLGMTGAWRTPSDEPLALESTPKVIDRSWPPRFTKLELVLEGERRAALTDPRRLARVLVRHDPRRDRPIAGLGFDALLELPSPARFAALIARRRGILKSLLLDQTFAAGVGNWIADEVLYQAGIDPQRTVQSLAPAEVTRLRSKLRLVVRTAVEADARKDRFPKTWLFHHRWGRAEDARTSRGEPIEFVDIAGRTTAWVPKRQR